MSAGPKTRVAFLRARAKRLSARPDPAFPCACGGAFVAVLDSRSVAAWVRRRRLCGKCGARVTTYERVVEDDVAARREQRQLAALVARLRAAFGEERP